MDHITVSFVAYCERYASEKEDPQSEPPEWLDILLARGNPSQAELERIQRSAQLWFNPVVTHEPGTVLVDPTSIVVARQNRLEGIWISDGVLSVGRWTAWFDLRLRPEATHGWMRDGQIDRDGEMAWFERFEPLSLEDGLMFLIGEEGRCLDCDLDGMGELWFTPQWPPIQLG